MIKTTTVRLTQTCSCVFTFTWDTATPSDQTFASVVKTCPVHSGLSGITLFNAAMGDNQTKNKMLAELRTYPELTISVTKDGKTIQELVEPPWNYTGTNDTRVLEFILSGTTLSNQKKTTIQAFADSSFGSGKVLIIG